MRVDFLFLCKITLYLCFCFPNQIDNNKMLSILNRKVHSCVLHYSSKLLLFSNFNFAPLYIIIFLGKCEDITDYITK